MPKRRTYADRREYIKAAVAKRRKKIKVMAVEYLGGACHICGYKRAIVALDFHHLDKHHKDFAVSQDGLTRAWSRVSSELDKCVLLCANCHREVHAGVIAAPRRNARRKTG
ncbi:hypothetical protein A3H10_04265 [Candidatus Uhrbacteria bacterium RIFCSPLOWO2_12_FULL_46_10]|uniref:HNH nuclease domain-containing protein n=1 Tax=Candidatus Uhrbacteria bacterium RIFCSPLOWO2_01_FULL_47_25 TaxID=1802402 RepID=A0A1F7UX22_9BACT|nr:MAG: hypothetical protein UX68_C0001G0011 [Parcubacteria group bacterium GW2011_GWA2_46_9]OGL60780.1 MAG: hypothetical protein A2752_03530 [Candidatus Uhrbacteria bacterium RIFCSPHIGHO2_01_FULL_46_23]OGL70082.1 MAG: hypothetical protein A3D60_03405 [Candidatus Uhrbacteria bacterium RIFCSPHIGHO2_02_FULL_47_29]OGL75968.1 MAG: hypothetical protein A3E96_01900 [Candidatus Uhrbacteria bacterium RIFCSPHIGHO2_12_FULL_46_13]OGL82843.1 MAG: hypothetical protein A2936_04230 [Candidatus Uhrbacteria bac